MNVYLFMFEFVDHAVVFTVYDSVLCQYCHLTEHEKDNFHFSRQFYLVDQQA